MVAVSLKKKKGNQYIGEFELIKRKMNTWYEKIKTCYDSGTD